MYEHTKKHNHKAIHVLRMMNKKCIPSSSDEKPYTRCKHHTIYIMVSPQSMNYYIGRTANPRLRESQHIYDAKCCKNNTYRAQQNTYAHQFMAKTSPESWCLIPILTDIDKANISRVERNVIKRFNAPLNTQYVRDHYQKMPGSWNKYTYQTQGRTEYHTYVTHKSTRIQKNHKPRKKQRIKNAQTRRESLDTLEPGTTMFKLERYDTTQIAKPTYEATNADLLFLIDKTFEQFDKNTETNDEVHYKITWRRREYDITKYKTLEFNFGQSIVADRKPGKRTRQTEYNLTEKINSIKRQRHGQIRLWKITRDKKVRFIKPKMYKRLEQIVKHQSVRKKTAKRIPFDDLVHMLKHTKNMSGKRRRKIARNFIHSTMAKKFNTPIAKRLTIKLPYTKNVPPKYLMGIMKRILKKSNLHPHLKTTLGPRTRFVFTKRDAIKDIFENNTAFIRNYDFTTTNKATCMCTALDPDNTLPRDEQGHIACKVSEANEEIKTMLNISSKNIPKPTQVDTRREIIQCTIDYLKQINKMIGPREKNQGWKRVRHTKEKCDDRDFNEMIKQMKIAGLNKESIRIVKKQIKEITKNIHWNEQDQQSQQSNLDDTKLRKLKEKYKHMIFSPLDKNNGCMHMCCPVSYTNAMKIMFKRDEEHYENINTSAEDINKKYRHFYETTTEVLNKVPDEKFDGNIPYAYVLFKNKDIKKKRPIVSYATHPLKKTLNITCRALNHMIQTITPDHAMHCNMETCVELKDRIKDFETRKKNEYGKNTRFAFIMGDVKNMYTELRHSTIKKAVDWIVTEFTKQTRRTEFTVKKRGKRGVTNGRATNTFTSTTITIQQIKKIVDFDLKHAIFAVGDPELAKNIYRQIIGVPMGSPLSPALAKITCMYFENIMLQKQKHEEISSIEGLRFMDDLLALGTFDCKSRDSRRMIKKQMEELTTCYDERMSLEIEAESGIGERNEPKETQYLQSNLIFKKNTIEMYENNKNALTIETEGKQKLLRFPHINSFAPTKQKIAICYQGAIAIERYSTTRDLKKRQFASLEKELRGPLEYPATFIKKTIEYMRQRTKREHDHWQHIYPMR